MLKITHCLVAIGAGACAMSASADPSYIGPNSGRDDLLVTPAPYPANKVDSPARTENGRLWISRSPLGSRTPIGEQAWGAPGPAAYGASLDRLDDVIYVRVNNTAVAISPWDSIDEGGLADLERARNIWLRENGYVMKVRTFVNPRYHLDESVQEASLPTPRATIRIRKGAPKGPERLQVRAPITGQPITRISKPNWATNPGPARVMLDHETAELVADSRIAR